jgi:hypothetical protein
MDAALELLYFESTCACRTRATCILKVRACQLELPCSLAPPTSQRDLLHVCALDALPHLPAVPHLHGEGLVAMGLHLGNKRIAHDVDHRACGTRAPRMVRAARVARVSNVAGE